MHWYEIFKQQGFFSVYSNLGPGSCGIGEICVILVNLEVFTNVISLQTVAPSQHGSTLYLFVHYYKSEIVIFECPRYSWIKDGKNYWKFEVLQIGKFRLLFGIMQALFPLGRNSLEKSLLKHHCRSTLYHVLLFSVVSSRLSGQSLGSLFDVSFFKVPNIQTVSTNLSTG